MYFSLKIIALLFIPSFLFLNSSYEDKTEIMLAPPTLCAGEYPDGHAFLVMGSDEIFLDHLPRIYHENHHYQLVCTATFPDSIKQIYLEDASENKDSFYMLVNREKFILPDMANALVKSFPAVILKFGMDIQRPRRLTDEFTVNVDRTIRFRSFPTEGDLSDTLQYFLFGNEKEVFVSNNVTFQPDFYVTSQLAERPNFSSFDPTKGLDVTVLNYFRKSPCQTPSDRDLRVYSSASNEESLLRIEKHLLFATAEVNAEDPCQ